jgi:hypothetical protein
MVLREILVDEVQIFFGEENSVLMNCPFKFSFVNSPTVSLVLQVQGSINVFPFIGKLFVDLAVFLRVLLETQLTLLVDQKI